MMNYIATVFFLSIVALTTAENIKDGIQQYKNLAFTPTYDLVGWNENTPLLVPNTASLLSTLSTPLMPYSPLQSYEGIDPYAAQNTLYRQALSTIPLHSSLNQLQGGLINYQSTLNQLQGYPITSAGGGLGNYQSTLNQLQGYPIPSVGGGLSNSQNSLSKLQGYPTTSVGGGLGNSQDTRLNQGVSAYSGGYPVGYNRQSTTPVTGLNGGIVGGIGLLQPGIGQSTPGSVVPGSVIGSQVPGSLSGLPPGFLGAYGQGLPGVHIPGSLGGINAGSFGGYNQGILGGATPGSFGGISPGNLGYLPGGTLGGFNPGSFGGYNQGIQGGVTPGSFGGITPGNLGHLPGTLGGFNPGSFGGYNQGLLGGVTPGSLGGYVPGNLGGHAHGPFISNQVPGSLAGGFAQGPFVSGYPLGSHIGGFPPGSIVSGYAPGSIGGGYGQGAVGGGYAPGSIVGGYSPGSQTLPPITGSYGQSFIGSYPPGQVGSTILAPPGSLTNTGSSGHLGLTSLGTSVSNSLVPGTDKSNTPVLDYIPYGSNFLLGGGYDKPIVNSGDLQKRIQDLLLNRDTTPTKPVKKDKE